ncbi:MAG: D-aminoacyl-tRNA deacylase [Patescibacteria group bacterium]
MRIVVQRVKQASVKINNKIVSQIGDGLLVLLAVHADDAPKDIDWLVKKVMNLRIFEDEAGKMNKSVRDAGGSILVVSQFTLYGDCTDGNRPSFIQSARPAKAKEYYEKFVDKLHKLKVPVESGKFQEQMEVELINDGPVTIIIDSK